MLGQAGEKEAQGPLQGLPPQVGPLHEFSAEPEARQAHRPSEAPNATTRVCGGKRQPAVLCNQRPFSVMLNTGWACRSPSTHPTLQLGRLSPASQVPTPSPGPPGLLTKARGGLPPLLSSGGAGHTLPTVSAAPLRSPDPDSWTNNEQGPSSASPPQSPHRKPTWI